MAKICYVPKTFRAGSLAVIETANAICAAYARQGFDLTLRQLYYQFVARGLIPNKDTEYDRLGSIINDARLAGLMDWNYIVDRTRNLRSVPHWDDPEGIIFAAARSYAIDRWDNQRIRPEVWIEKDALVGVIQGVCERNDVAYFSCRGYVSQSEVWAAGQRIGRYLNNGQAPIIFHLGDHDPSGLDMTRDIQARLSMFCYEEIEVRRLALTMEQVDHFNPPPNPAKLSDGRSTAYIAEYGDSSWELDALDPATIDDLIQEAIDDVRDPESWELVTAQMERERETLTATAKRWAEVARLVNPRSFDEEADDDE